MSFDKGRVIYHGKRPNQIKYPSRYTETQWSENNSLAHKSSQTERQRVEGILAESFRLADETEEVRKWGQKNVEYLFKRRIQDIRQWIDELDFKFNEIGGLIEDVGVVVRRLEGVIESLRPIVSVDLEVLEKREGRVGVDLVCDGAQREVLKELQLVEDVRVSAEGYLGGGKESLRLLRKFQFDLNKELGDKREAMRVDTEACGLGEHVSGVMRVEGVSDFCHVRDEEEWDLLTRKYKTNADKLLHDTTSFMIKIESFLRLSCEQLEKQVCETNAAFERRLYEIRSAKAKLENEHLEVAVKVREMEDALDKLKKLYIEKESSLALTETRLSVRSRRPNLELVNDTLQRQLHSEAQELKIQMARIQSQIQTAKVAFHKLQAHQVEIEDGINVKINSIGIDETVVMPLRRRISVHFI